MTKYEYILRQFSKTNKKNYENYVVTRIWHRLDSLDYKFVTQQYVLRANGKYALTDMYFPQCKIHIEVDESHHQFNVTNDKIRENDIVNITGHEIIRVDVTKGVEDINLQIEKIIEMIREKRVHMKDEFVAWEPNLEVSTATYIEKGYIDRKDNVAFKRESDAINCFGVNYKGWQRGGAKHPREEGVHIWFPKLYKNGLWDNSITDDEEIIYEKSMEDSKVDSHIDEIITYRDKKRIVFARVKDSLGEVMYRFMGEYHLNIYETKAQRRLVWERKKTRVRTYACNLPETT
ncbi:AbaSI family restriction endonuclease [Clostridium fungisolvens]|uniref:Uncharacterized protein n=1 Tax=Clostridium fungisolvens TaxID=1604897 RepID=A0A6V8SE55_9CLOT|nr:hypothetical protein [Clostridium fungisolvens]GFP75514.1 hypothetical protein bsdtw1_01598 [Clostridium fungisolvens]